MAVIGLQHASFKTIGLVDVAKQFGVNWYLTTGVYVSGGKLLNTLDTCHPWSFVPLKLVKLYSIVPPPLSVASTVIEPTFVGQVGCTPDVVNSIVGGGVKKLESYIIKALPSAPSLPAGLLVAPICVILKPCISDSEDTRAVNGNIVTKISCPKSVGIPVVK